MLNIRLLKQSLKYESAKIQKYESTKIQKYKSTKVQKYENTKSKYIFVIYFKKNF